MVDLAPECSQPRAPPTKRKALCWECPTTCVRSMGLYTIELKFYNPSPKFCKISRPSYAFWGSRVVWVGQYALRLRKTMCHWTFQKAKSLKAVGVARDCTLPQWWDRKCLNCMAFHKGSRGSNLLVCQEHSKGAEYNSNIHCDYMTLLWRATNEMHFSFLYLLLFI